MCKKSVFEYMVWTRVQLPSAPGDRKEAFTRRRCHWHTECMLQILSISRIKDSGVNLSASYAPVAQLAEQRIFNPFVGGSNPPRRTIIAASTDLPSIIF